MAVSTEFSRLSRVEISGAELTGALGDSVTVLPIVVALAATTELALGPVLLLFGLFQVVWGLAYGLPLSVEPMKALAGLAIVGALTYGELVAAGLLAGVVLLVLAATGGLTRLQAVVGTPVVRGVQLAVGLLLARTGLELGVGSPLVALAGVGLAGVVALAGYRRAGTLVVLAAGAAVAVATAGLPAPRVPAVTLMPARPAFTVGAVEGTLAQLAMTVGNAAVATSLLCTDLFDRDVSPDRLSASMGTMTLASVPLGGLPMCHGSGGLAGKYAFGARTAGANVLLGVLYVAAALVAGAGLILAFPMALLGVLLVLVAVQLARSARETDHLPLTVAVGVLGLVTNVGVAFLAGAAGYWVLSRRSAGRAGPG